jgi:hypothetical protein
MMTRTHFAGQNGAAVPEQIDPSVTQAERDAAWSGTLAALTQIAQPVSPQTTEQINAMLRLRQEGMTGTVPQIVNREAPMVLMADYFETPQGRAADTEGLSRVMARIYAPLAWGSVGAFCAVLVMAILDANCVGC